MNSFKFSDAELDSPNLGAEPEGEAVDWGEIRRRVDDSLETLGLHECKEHYLAGVWAYEDQTGVYPDPVACDRIHGLVSELIQARF